MHQPYVSFLLLLVFVAANAALLIGLSHFAAPRRPTPTKLAPYESGMPPLGDAHERFCRLPRRDVVHCVRHQDGA
jgi:NADH-quinone oxidoreductase subunit A